MQCGCRLVASLRLRNLLSGIVSVRTNVHGRGQIIQIGDWRFAGGTPVQMTDAGSVPCSTTIPKARRSLLRALFLLRPFRFVVRFRPSARRMCAGASLSVIPGSDARVTGAWMLDSTATAVQDHERDRHEPPTGPVRASTFNRPHQWEPSHGKRILNFVGSDDPPAKPQGAAFDQADGLGDCRCIERQPRRVVRLPAWSSRASV